MFSDAKGVEPDLIRQFHLLQEVLDALRLAQLRPLGRVETRFDETVDPKLKASNPGRFRRRVGNSVVVLHTGSACDFQRLSKCRPDRLEGWPPPPATLDFKVVRPVAFSGIPVQARRPTLELLRHL